MAKIDATGSLPVGLLFFDAEAQRTQRPFVAKKLSGLWWWFEARRLCSGLFRRPPQIARFSDVFCAGAPARSVTARAPRGASPSSARAPCARSRPAPLASPRPPASARTAPRGASSGSAGQSGGRPPGVVPEGHRKLAGGEARNERNHRITQQPKTRPRGAADMRHHKYLSSYSTPPRWRNSRYSS